MSAVGARTIWMTVLALLLPPTAYAMATEKFGLAAVCVAAIVGVRVIGLPSRPPDRDDEDDDRRE